MLPPIIQQETTEFHFVGSDRGRRLCCREVLYEDDFLYFVLRYTYRDFQTHSSSFNTEERIPNFPVVRKFVDIPFHFFLSLFIVIICVNQHGLLAT